MATESVDELDRILENYKEYVTGVYQGVADYDEATAKAALQAYYTRECARKVLEGRLEEANCLGSKAESIRVRSDASSLGSHLTVIRYHHILDRIAELRAALNQEHES